MLLPRKINVVNKEEWEVVSFFGYNPYCKPIYDQFVIVLFWLVLLTCQQNLLLCQFHENVLHKNNNPPFLFFQPSYHKPHQVVILIQQPPPYPMSFKPNSYTSHYPSSNIHQQSTPALQSNYLNQMALNDESDFMARLVKQVSEELKKKHKWNNHNIRVSMSAPSFSPFWYFLVFFFILKYQTKVVVRECTSTDFWFSIYSLS